MDSSLSGEMPVGDGNFPSKAFATSVSQAAAVGRTAQQQDEHPCEENRSAHGQTHGPLPL